jgi:hypothetical protein
MQFSSRHSKDARSILNLSDNDRDGLLTETELALSAVDTLRT